MPNTKAPECRCLPLVIVEGFLGRTGGAVWGDFKKYLNQDCDGCKRRVIFTSVGPVSSLHDRACELYYSLVGGTVDYGNEHSAAYGHSQFGRTIQGLYPQWSSENPLHFLGHSIGGSTVVKLQHLLKQGFFGPSTHPNWIRSVNTISSPFRGTQAVYILGECTGAAPRVRAFSLGSIVAKCILVISYLSPILPRALDLHIESRRISFHDITMLSLLKQLWKSDWAESPDAAPYDVTFGAVDQREAIGEGEPHPETFYRSCATFMPTSGNSLSMLLSPMLFMVQTISSFDFSTIRPVPSFLQSDDNDIDIKQVIDAEQDSLNYLPKEYRVNDGVVPLYSQWHPLPCNLTRCQHSKGSPTRGMWIVEEWNDTTHLSLVPLWVGSNAQKQYWLELGCWLRALEQVKEHDVSLLVQS